MNIVRRFHNFVLSLSTLKFIVLITFIAQIVTKTSIFIISFLSGVPFVQWGGHVTSTDNITSEIIILIIIGPYIETLAFQALIISLCEQIKKDKIKIIISALCFGLAHLTNSIYYFIATIPIGILLAYSYLLYKQKNKKPVLIVSTIHGLYNAISLTLALIELSLLK